MANTKKNRVKPFAPLGKRVVSPTLKPAQKKENVMSDEQIARIAAMVNRHQLQQAQERASRQYQLFTNEVRRTDLA